MGFFLFQIFTDTHIKYTLDSTSEYYSVFKNPSYDFGKEIGDIFIKKSTPIFIGSTQMDTANLDIVKILLTDEKQPLGGVFSKAIKDNVSSFGLKSESDSSITIRIWINPLLNNDSTKATSYFNKTILDAFITMTHPQNQDLLEYKELQLSKFNSDNNYFIIKKNE